MYTGNHRRHPLPSPIFRLRSALGGVVENRFCTWGPNPRLDYWGGNIKIPVSKPMSHLNFPPKLCSNSIFKPCSRLKRGGARQLTLHTLGSKFTNIFNFMIVLGVALILAMSIPVVDFEKVLSCSEGLSSCDAVQELHSAFTTVGFVFIRNHGIDRRMVGRR